MCNLNSTQETTICCVWFHDNNPRKKKYYNRLAKVHYEAQDFMANSLHACRIETAAVVHFKP